jgi:guanosine-3',5'-bis(diphosphate) 3'-pyrophosphohydrolase
MTKIAFDLELYRNQMRRLIGDQPNAHTFWDALDFAVEAHHDQWRRSGDAYILHPCSVAKILAEELDITDPEILAAALLHDTVEDVPEVTLETVKAHFGDYVQAIVDGCTKVTHRSWDRQTQNKRVHRKIFSGASLRPEVMLVKLADRLHNLRTLQAMPKEKRQRIADETLDIYAPLATAFGLFNMKREMYNLAICYKFPRKAGKLKNHIKELSVSDSSRIIVEQLRVAAMDARLECDISRRTKDLWAYYNNTDRQLLQRIDTPIEIIITAHSIADCYTILGMVNQNFRPIPRTIRDFIANPKPTGYQGLHARAIVDGQRYLFKVRTKEMARKAQRGIFRNWSSKHGKQGRFIQGLQEMLEIIGSDETVSYRDLIAAGGMGEIYTYTPQGDLICLPTGACVLDFAFHVHTEIGHSCIGAMIREQKVGIDYVLKDGQMVRIIRAPRRVAFEPGVEKRCKTPKARSELSKSFRLRRDSVAAEIGEATLQQEMQRYGLPRELLAEKGMDEVADSFAVPDKARFFANIGKGLIRLPEAIERIRNLLFNGNVFLVPPTGAFNKIRLDTLDPVFIKLSGCCNPNPAEKGNCALLTEHALSVHRKDCGRLHEIPFQREDAVDIAWERSTPIEKRQSVLFQQISRQELLHAISLAPPPLIVHELAELTGKRDDRQDWEMIFSVGSIKDLREVTKHFDKLSLNYEFLLDF